MVILALILLSSRQVEVQEKKITYSEPVTKKLPLMHFFRGGK